MVATYVGHDLLQNVITLSVAYYAGNKRIIGMCLWSCWL